MSGSAHSAANAQPIPAVRHDRDEIVLELSSVSRSYGTGDTAVTALDEVSLQLRRGELVAIMGTSGSGKSTLLTIAGGLDRPTSGRVFVNGTQITGLGAKKIAALRRKTLGFVFQDYNLVPVLTAIENVALPLELDGISARAARRSAKYALEAVGLLELANRYPDDMSGGQQQRVSIARAIVGDRSIILADEPTGALDSVTGESVLSMMRQRIDSGAAGILVTHDARHAAWADRIIYLRDGRITDETRANTLDGILATGA